MVADGLSLYGCVILDGKLAQSCLLRLHERQQVLCLVFEKGQEHLCREAKLTLLWLIACLLGSVAPSDAPLVPLAWHAE